MGSARPHLAQTASTTTDSNATPKSFQRCDHRGSGAGVVFLVYALVARPLDWSFADAAGVLIPSVGSRPSPAAALAASPLRERRCGGSRRAWTCATPSSQARTDGRHHSLIGPFSLRKKAR